VALAVAVADAVAEAVAEAFKWRDAAVDQGRGIG